MTDRDARMTFPRQKAPPPAASRTAAIAAPAYIPADEIPADTLEIARHALLDWLTALLAGWEDPAVLALRQYAREEGKPPSGKGSRLLGSGERVGKTNAALVNGLASHVLDVDDAHLASRIHASAALWPSIFAVGESEKASGMDALAAFVAGMEAGGMAAALAGEGHYRRGWHNTATLGSFGATVAAARLMKLPPERLCHALGLAATLTGGLRALFGTPGKPLHAGRAAANGVMAADLAQRGVEAVTDIFDRSDGYLAVAGDSPSPPLPSGTRSRWQANELLFKYHASCYGTQAPIEAALRLREQLIAQKGEKAVDMISRLDMEIEPQYLMVCDRPAPATAMEARFSVRHMAALALLGMDTVGNADIAGHLRNPALLALRQRVRVIAAQKPARAKAVLRARLTDGGIREQSFDASRPEPLLKRQKERLRAKSSRLLASRFSPARIEALHQLIDGFAASSSVRHWVQEWSRLLLPELSLAASA
ncbi:MAG: MmgE/PrpD family protein [Zoogloeaceae bacterium]|jgi:2-methylcitrate dehydratase PrpD|nr:MmgE/PrpD family protein [Zoogloeaceae bacterium]